MSDNEPQLALPPAAFASRFSRGCWFTGLAISGCLADLASKSAIFSWLDRPTTVPHIHWLVEGYVGFQTTLNRGALFGLGQNMVWLFAAISVGALVAIAYWLYKGAIDDWLLTVTLGLVTGGILGNLYDRLGLWSNFQEFAVRDWIRLSYDFDTFVWPNFNIADSLLVCGAVLLLLHSALAPDASKAELSAKTPL